MIAIKSRLFLIEKRGAGDRELKRKEVIVFGRKCRRWTLILRSCRARKVTGLWPEMEHLYDIACTSGRVRDMESEIECFYFHLDDSGQL